MTEFQIRDSILDVICLYAFLESNDITDSQAEEIRDSLKPYAERFEILMDSVEAKEFENGSVIKFLLSRIVERFENEGQA